MADRVEALGYTEREGTMNRNLRWVAWTGLCLVVAGCGVGNPLEALQGALDRLRMP